MEDSLKVLRYVLTIGLPLLIFIFITVNIVSHDNNNFDSYVYQRVSGFITPGLTDIMRLITFFGSREFFMVLALILIVAFFRKNNFSFYASMIVINLLLSSLLSEGIKYIFHRNRPEILRLINIGGYSFPSGHSMVSMSFYGFLIYLCCKNYKTRWKYLIVSLLTILILLIGLSRIYLGVHYASDVLGGFVLGITWVGVYSTIVDLRYRKKHANVK
jgi:undecaprenyl-diphosphatase